MKIIIVDDEAPAVRNLRKKLASIRPESEITGFTDPEEALAYAERNRVDVAFLNIEMNGINGITAAKMLKNISPDIRVIFVTGFSGYLLKPAKTADIERELTFACGREKPLKKIRIQTFGGFEVFAGEKRVVFKRSKSKELLAYLVDRKGAAITTKDACAVLWEDAEYNVARKNYFQTVVADMMASLKSEGIESIIVKSRNSIAVDKEKLDCDSYRFMAGDVNAVNLYRHDYMICYSWAESTMGILENLFEK